MGTNRKYKINNNNNYIEFYNKNIIRRWYYNNYDNLWYEFCPDYSHNLKYIKTEEVIINLEPIIYTYNSINNYSLTMTILIYYFSITKTLITFFF